MDLREIVRKQIAAMNYWQATEGWDENLKRTLFLWLKNPKRGINSNTLEIILSQLQLTVSPYKDEAHRQAIAEAANTAATQIAARIDRHLSFMQEAHEQRERRRM